MDTLRGIESFVKAVETGSIAAAARILGISAAAASQNIARLESALGVRLLTRTTRSLALTDSGAVYFEQVRHVITDLELAHSAVTEHHGEPQGRLRVSSSAAFGRHVLAKRIPAFQKKYPLLAVELFTTDGSVDLVTEQVDISIRIREQLDEGLVARKIATVPSIFCASPDYLERAGVPKEPEDLRHHDNLVFRVPSDGRILRWGYFRKGERFEVDVRAAMVSDDIDVLATAAVAGGGVTRLGAFVAQPLLDSGQLVQLFTKKSGVAEADVEPLDFYLCVRDRYSLTPKVRRFTEYLMDSLPPDWRAT